MVTIDPPPDVFFLIMTIDNIYKKSQHLVVIGFTIKLSADFHKFPMIALWAIIYPNKKERKKQEKNETG